MILFGGVAFLTFLGSLGAFFFKQATGTSRCIMNILKNKFFYIGLCTYASSAILNVIMLRFFDYSILYPMTALTYVWTLFLSWKYLGEKLTFRKLAGIIIVVGGVLILTT